MRNCTWLHSREFIWNISWVLFSSSFLLGVWVSGRPIYGWPRKSLTHFPFDQQQFVTTSLLHHISTHQFKQCVQRTTPVCWARGHTQWVGPVRPCIPAGDRQQVRHEETRKWRLQYDKDSNNWDGELESNLGRLRERKEKQVRCNKMGKNIPGGRAGATSVWSQKYSCGQKAREVHKRRGGWETAGVLGVHITRRGKESGFQLQENEKPLKSIKHGNKTAQWEAGWEVCSCPGEMEWGAATEPRGTRWLTLEVYHRCVLELE